MSSQLPFLDSPWIDDIGWMLVHSTWQIAVIAVAFIATRFALWRRSANVRYLCGCLTLAAMVVWPVATFVSMATSPTPLQLPVPAEASPSTLSSATLVTSPSTPLVDDATALPAANSNSIANASGYLQVFAENWRDLIGRAAPWLTLAWLIGASLTSIRPLRGLWTVRRLKTQGLAPLEAKLRRLAGELMVRMCVRDAVQFAESALVEVPTVVGFLRPMVLLPASAIGGLSVEQMELVLAHELAHIRRHDFLVNLAQTVVESLLFYHPAAWWVSREVRRERENCCDDVATDLCGNRAVYARALYALATHRQVAVPALAASGGSLATRVRRMLGQPPIPGGSDCSAPWAAGLIVLLFLSALLALGPAVAAENSEDSSIKLEPSAVRGDLTNGTTNEPQQRKRWIAVGRVTNDEGVPMSGVEISAACGVGSLLPTGSTTTDADGKYRLAFGPGMQLASDSDVLQAATITASKPGYFEQNLNRQGNCLAGERLPDDAEENWGGDTARVFVHGIPKSLDFVMQRAAILEGTFSETSSNGFVREQSFYLVGTELPPSQSVLESAATDVNGRFRIDGIPTGKEWRIGMRVPHTWIEIETEPFKFDQPGIYRGRVLLNSTSGSDGVKMSLRFADLEQVATADQTREIDALDAEGFSKLHRAASGGHVDRVRTLLSGGANVDVEQGTYRGTPLQYAATRGHGETVQALLEHDASVDARDTQGRSPLLWAASNGHADVVRRLLDAGADVNAAANGGWTALHYAVDRGHTEVAQLLIDRGADLRLKNSNGVTPFDLNPKLDLQVPWQSLRQSAELTRPTGASRSSTTQPVHPDERPLPDHPPDLVVATFRTEPIRWRDLTPPPDWYKQRAEYLQKNGHTLGFETPDAFVMTRLRSKIQSPLFEAYREEQRLAPTEAERAEFRQHWKTAKDARTREAGQLIVSLGQTPEQEEFFAKWYVSNWKLQASLFHKYGGRAIYQQVGPEAIDAMRDFLKENESKGAFAIQDPQLRKQFWEPFTRENPGVLIPDPAKVFAHPWSSLE